MNDNVYVVRRYIYLYKVSNISQKRPTFLIVYLKFPTIKNKLIFLQKIQLSIGIFRKVKLGFQILSDNKTSHKKIFVLSNPFRNIFDPTLHKLYNCLQRNCVLLSYPIHGVFSPGYYTDFNPI